MKDNFEKRDEIDKKRISNQELKAQMMNLWQATFHDSSEYISIVFDNYYNCNYSAVDIENGAVVASLLGVPYSFSIDGRKQRGLYLCGLATEPEYRRRGIMGRLIKEIGDRAKADGFDFLFLLPASDGLRDYYRNFNFVDFFFINTITIHPDFDFNSSLENYLLKHDLNNDKRTKYCSLLRVSKFTDKFDYNIFDFVDYILSDMLAENSTDMSCENIIDKSLKIYEYIVDKSYSNFDKKSISNREGSGDDILGKNIMDYLIKIYNENGQIKYDINRIRLYLNLLKFVTEREGMIKGNHILHSFRDWHVVCREFILSGGEILFSTLGSGAITGVMFCGDKEEDIVEIPHASFMDRCSKLALLKKVSADHNGCEIRFHVPAVNPRMAAASYGMICDFSDSENLKICITDGNYQNKSNLANFILQNSYNAEIEKDNIADPYDLEKLLWSSKYSFGVSVESAVDIYLLLE